MKYHTIKLHKILSKRKTFIFKTMLKSHNFHFLFEVPSLSILICSLALESAPP